MQPSQANFIAPWIANVLPEPNNKIAKSLRRSGCDSPSQVCDRRGATQRGRLGRQRSVKAPWSSVAKALLGDASLARFPFLTPRCCIRLATGLPAGWPPLTSLGLEGCAGLARRSRSSSGARSKRRMMDCISSAVGASIKAKPFDSWVSWLRITLIESATRSSAVNHCLMSSAVTQVGRLPKKNSKAHSVILFTPFVGFWYFKGKDSDLVPVKSYQSGASFCKPD